jgi:hypothetical protein
MYGENPGESAVRDRICDKLNAEGVTRRYSKIWIPMTALRIAER